MTVASPAPPSHARAPVPGRPGTLPIYVREVVEEARRTEFETVRRRPLAKGAVALLSVMRDEAAVLGDFLAHYRRLGVDRFIVIDNGSADGTAEALAAEPDVDLLIRRRGFLPQFKQGWLTRAIALYGHDRWYLAADADEHLVYDGAPERPLAALVALAAAHGLRRVRGMLVDMYAEGPAAPAPGASLAARFPLFDGEGYAERLCKQRISRKGGPRLRFFAARGLAIDPEMTKYPLFHIREGEIFDNPHHLHPYAENFVSPCHLGLLHYKFNAGFAAKVRTAVAEGSYFDGSAEYRAYQAALACEGTIALAGPLSRRYAGPEDLARAGLIDPLPWPGRPAPAGGGLLARARSLLGR